jgi:hypothetical protein
MSNFFEKVATDMDNMEQKFLGPDYKYYKFIKNPNELGMSGGGSIGDLSTDIAGIINYVELLVSGEGRASTTGKPLGDKFFLSTGGQCKDIQTGKLVTRSMYINNVPTGDINFLPAMPNLNVGAGIRGLIPGVLNNLGDINPIAMFSAFMEGNEPPCAEVTLETIDENNIVKNKSAYVPIHELKQLQSGGNIPSGTVTGKMLEELQKSSNSKEGFINFCDNCNGNNKLLQKLNIKKTNGITSVYYIIFTLLLTYIVMKIIYKTK